MTRPANYVGAARTVRSITYGTNVTGAFGTGTQTFASGTAANLTLSGGGSGSTITVNSGTAGDITIGNISTGGTYGNIVLADNLAVAHNGSGLLILNRPITGAFNITKTGTGTLQLGAANTASGTLYVNEGTVRASTSSATGGDLNAFSGINLGGGALEIRSASVASSKTYDLVGVTVSSASSLIYQNTDSYSITANFSGTAAFALNADLTVRNTSTNTTLVSGVNLSRNITGSGRMIVESFNDIAASSANYSLGRLLLSGDNSNWSGGITVAKGTASLGGNAVNAAGTGSIVIGTTGVNFGAGLTFFPTGANGSTVTYANDITVRSGGFRSIKGSGTDHNIVLNGDIALEGDLNVDHSLSVSGRAMTLGGEISGAGGLNITRNGGNAESRLILTGTNNYTGATTIASGATLRIGNGTDAGSIGSTSGITNNGALVFSVGTGDRSMSAVISGSGTLTKEGSGTLTLSGANDYSGATSVTAGGLVVNGSLVSALTMDTGTVLSGTGSFSGSVSISGTHNPGNSPGVQNFSALTYNSGATVNWELNANTITQGNGTLGNPYTFDQVVVSGALDFAGATDLNLAFNTVGSNVNWTDAFWSTSRSWTLFSSNTLSNANNLTLSTENWLDGSGNSFNTSLAGASFNLSTVGNDVVLNYSAIPEPSTYAAMAGLSALGCAFWRRRRAARTAVL